VELRSAELLSTTRLPLAWNLRDGRAASPTPGGQGPRREPCRSCHREQPLYPLGHGWEGPARTQGPLPR